MALKDDVTPADVKARIRTERIPASLTDAIVQGYIDDAAALVQAWANRTISSGDGQHDLAVQVVTDLAALYSIGFIIEGEEFGKATRLADFKVDGSRAGPTIKLAFDVLKVLVQEGKAILTSTASRSVLPTTTSYLAGQGLID